MAAAQGTVGALAEAIRWWSGRSVAITGGTGFIGGAIIERLLDAGAHVHALDWDGNRRVPHHRLAWHPGDIRNLRDCVWLLARSQPSVVLHLAAVSQVEEAGLAPMAAFETNTMGAVSLLEAARLLRMESTPIVIASTDKVYGPAEGPVGEASPLRPRHPYDASKAAADLAAESYRRHYGLNVALMRTANIYGPGDMNLRRIVPHVIYRSLYGLPPVLRSDGTPIREYLYIDDCVDGYLDLAYRLAVGETPLPHTAVMAGQAMSVRDLVDLIQTLLGDHVPPVVQATAIGETTSIRLENNFGRMTIGLGVGLRRTADWMRAELGIPTPL